MRKQIWLGLVLVLLGVCGALIWRAGSACLEYQGLKGEKISPQQFSHWLKTDENVLSEIKKGRFYVQEAIGSNSIILTSPQKIDGNFALAFDLMSMTRSAVIKIVVIQEDGSEVYSFEMRQKSSNQIAKISQGADVLKQIESTVIRPDKFYHFQFEKIGPKLTLSINGAEILNALTAQQNNGGKILLFVQGQPDHPAAVEFKNIVLYR